MNLFWVNYITYKFIIIMLIWYVTIKRLRQTCLLISSIVVYAADTFVNDFTWTHCASCLFNTAWFICLHVAADEKTYLKPRCTPFPGNMSFNPETVAKRWAPVWTWTCPRTGLGWASSRVSTNESIWGVSKTAAALTWTLLIKLFI